MKRLSVIVISLIVLAGGSESVDSYAQGKAYGEELKMSLGPRADRNQLMAICAKSIRDGQVKDLRTGEYAAGGMGLNDADFREGCTAAVTQTQ